MQILAIETTGAFASVALAKAGETGTECRILDMVEGSDRFSHLQNLTPQIQQVLGASSINDVSAIAVSAGPGSFTGIRIGVSTARALAQVTDITCVPVRSIEALAMRAAELPGGYEEGTLICPILDARRSQVYGGGYLLENGYPVEVVKAGPYTIEEFMDAIRAYNKVCFFGDGIGPCGEKILQIRADSGEEDGVAFAPEEIRYQSAEQIAKLGAKYLTEGRGCSFADLKPEYMRLAEAERKLKKK